MGRLSEYRCGEMRIEEFHPRASAAEVVNSASEIPVGEVIIKGDRVLFHGEPGEIEFIVDRIVGDPDLDWYMEQGPGVMVLESKLFGRAFIRDTEKTEELLFLARSEGS
jgi:hypothetical protein